jgi:hypothetical protein
MPEEVQTREGYGEGINEDYHNYIEYAEDGRVLYHDKVFEYVFKTSHDISKAFISGQATFRYYIHKANDNIINRLYGKSDGKISICDRLPLVSDELDSVGYYLDSTSATMIVKSPYATIEETKEWLNGVRFILALAEPIVTDITDLMPKENLIKVLGGCRIVAENEQSDPVPFSVKYLVTYPKGG